MRATNKYTIHIRGNRCLYSSNVDFLSSFKPWAWRWCKSVRLRKKRWWWNKLTLQIHYCSKWPLHSNKSLVFSIIYSLPLTHQFCYWEVLQLFRRGSEKMENTLALKKYVIVTHHLEFSLHLLCFSVLYAKVIRGSEETSQKISALYLIN